MTKQQQRRADLHNGAASIASGAGFLAAAIGTLLLIALVVGIASQGVLAALGTIALLAYLRHTDKAKQQRILDRRNPPPVEALPRLSPQADVYAANARARRDAGA